MRWLQTQADAFIESQRRFPPSTNFFDNLMVRVAHSGDRRSHYYATIVVVVAVASVEVPAAMVVAVPAADWPDIACGRNEHVAGGITLH